MLDFIGTMATGALMVLVVAALAVTFKASDTSKLAFAAIAGLWIGFAAASAQAGWVAIGTPFPHIGLYVAGRWQQGQSPRQCRWGAPDCWPCQRGSSSVSISGESSRCCSSCSPEKVGFPARSPSMRAGATLLRGFLPFRSCLAVLRANAQLW